MDQYLNLKEELICLQNEQFYHQQLQRSYEAKVERVDPQSEEFEGVVKGMLDSRKKIRQLGLRIAFIKYELSIKDFEAMF